MSTSWGSDKFWPSRFLRNSSKLPVEGNSEILAARPYPRLQASRSSLDPAPIQNSSQLGPAPCSQHCHLDPPYSGSRQEPQSRRHLTRSASTETLTATSRFFFSFSVPLDTSHSDFFSTDPAFTCPSPTPRTSLRPHAQTTAPHHPRSSLVPPPRPILTWFHSLPPLAQTLRVVHCPITDRHPRPSSRDTHLNFALNPALPDSASCRRPSPWHMNSVTM